VLLLSSDILLSGLGKGGEVWDSSIGLVGGSVQEVNVGLGPSLMLFLASHVLLLSLSKSAEVWDSGVGLVSGGVEEINMSLSPCLVLLLASDGTFLLHLDGGGSVGSSDGRGVGLGAPVEVVGVWVLVPHPVVPLLLASGGGDVVVLDVGVVLEGVGLDLDGLAELLHSANTYSKLCKRNGLEAKISQLTFIELNSS